ncbi:zinc-dependent metalloprotease [uncultured Psychroserpens sp.]|uniref:zinc-dependent metalloprotease n=1 Tax=uncultured Psychroserpens sp. TaxID=255436 RepID=UPI00261E1810|nr:T9SS type A sorting domain-containing protein [uncultured Psychroserpens sp.]
MKIRKLQTRMLMIILLSTMISRAQKNSLNCVDETSSEFVQPLNRISDNNFRHESSQDIVNLPVIVHLIGFPDNDSTLGEDDIARYFSVVNSYFYKVGLRLYLVEIRYISEDPVDNDLNVLYQYLDTTAYNLPIRYFGGNSGGANNVISFISNNSIGAEPFDFNQTSLHELGHNYGLLHTFAGTELGNNHPLAENVARSGSQANCDTKGDGICDTPADNYSSFNDFDIHGEPYHPDYDNIMSYYNRTKSFTEQQYEVMRAGFQHDLSTTSHIRLGQTINYSLDSYVQTDIPDAPVLSSLGATHLDNRMSWSVVSNSMGYMVERSEVSSEEGFVTIALSGVSENTTEFIDRNIQPNTTYWYRVISVNSKEAYSNVLQVTSNEILYCSPEDLSDCNFFGSTQFYPRRVIISDNVTSVLDTPDITCRPYISIQDYGSVILYPNTDYQLDLDMYNYNNGFYNVFLDLNQDGDFEDSGEWVVSNIYGERLNDVQTTFSFDEDIVVHGTTIMRMSFSNYELINACEFPNGLTSTQDYIISLGEDCSVDIYGNFDTSDTDFADGNPCTALPFGHFNPAWNTPFPWKATEYYAAYHTLLTENFWGINGCSEIVNQGTGTNVWMLGSSNPIDTSPAGNESVIAFWVKRKHYESVYNGVFTDLNDLEIGKQYRLSFYDSPVSTPGGRQTPNLYYKTKVKVEDASGEQEWDGPNAHYYNFNSTAPNIWYEREMTFTATSESMKLTLEFPLYPDPNNIVNDGYVAIDEIKVTCLDNMAGRQPVVSIDRETIENSISDEIKLYPNPTKGWLTVDLSNIKEVIDLVTVYNLQGAKVKSEKPTSSNTIDISDLQSGMYFVKIETSTGKSNTQKIIKL